MANRYKVAGKYLPPAKVCEDCGAIIGRGDDAYPDNHWEWCSEYVRGGSGAVGPEASEPGSPCIDAPMPTGMGTQREVTRVAAVSHPSPDTAFPEMRQG